MAIKLHLGCGKRFIPGFIHYDKGNFPHVVDNNITRLPHVDNSVDLIYASHVLEYFDRQEVGYILQEWHRALKPDGILRLAVPDFEAIARLYTQGKFGLESFLGPLYGKMPAGDETIYHRTTYDFDSLSNLLQNVGFKEIIRYDWRDTEHSHIDDHSQAYLPKMDKENGTLISLNVEARK